MLWNIHINLFSISNIFKCSSTKSVARLIYDLWWRGKNSNTTDIASFIASCGDFWSDSIIQTHKICFDPFISAEWSWIRNNASWYVVTYLYFLFTIIIAIIPNCNNCIEMRWVKIVNKLRNMKMKSYYFLIYQHQEHVLISFFRVYNDRNEI